MTDWITERTDNTVTSGSTTVGSVSTGLLDADNIRIDGNTISSTDTNGNITLSPDGTGIVSMTSTGNAEIKITGPTNKDAQLSLYGDRDWYIQNDGDASLGTADFLHIRDATAAASRLVIDTSGNVGIGVTTPNAPLHIQSASDAPLRVQSTDGVTGIKFKDVDDESNLYYVGNINSWYFSSGKVGIGTSTPDTNFHVSSAVDAEIKIEADTNNTPEGDNPRLILAQDGDTVQAYFGIEGSSGTLYTGSLNNATYIEAKSDATSETNIQFVTGGDLNAPSIGTARMIITDTGEIGIGIAAPTSSLHIDQSSASGAMPVLTLDQGDESEEMMEFLCTIGTGNAIEAVGGKSLTTTHFIKVTIQGGLTRYFPVGTIA